MKKIKCFSLLMLPLLLCSCDQKEENKPTTIHEPGTVDQTGISIYPRHSRAAGCVGDPMPYYENGKMYVYYLEDARNYTTGYHPISLFETTDYVHYNDYGEVLHYVDDITSPEMALATGSVIKDKAGQYHFFYGGHNNHAASVGLPYKQVVEHATSSDLHNWEKHTEYGFYGDHDDFRDPYVFYMDSDNCYWMLICSRATSGRAALKLYKSTDLWHWTNNGDFYTNSVPNTECPSLIHYKGYWYLSWSENGAHGYTYYCYKKNLSDPEWIIPSNYFDGFYAGRPVVADNDRMFMYGWIPTKNGFDGAEYQWAGNLSQIELVQTPNGELAPVLAKEIKDTLNHEVGYKTSGKKEITKTIFFEKLDDFRGTTYEQIKTKKITRISFDYTPKSSSGQAGLTMGATSDNSVGLACFDFNTTRKQFIFYNDCQNNHNFGGIDYSLFNEFEVNKKYHVELVYQDGVSEMFFDDTLVLTMRTISFSQGLFGFYAKGQACEFSNITFYE